MSRPHFLASLACALLGLLILVTPARALKGPRISFDQTEKTYDQIKEGVRITAKFTFKNTGDQNLIISSVTPSCGCTATMYDKVVRPGETGSVTVVLDTSGITGAFRKTAVVATNDPTRPYVTLVLYGETQSRIKIDKGRRVKLIGCVNRPVSVTATLTDPDGKQVLIAGVENPMKDYLDAKLKPVPGGKAYKLIITSKATSPVEFAGPLFLRVPDGSRVSLYVVADIKGAFTVQPHEVYFGAVPKKGPAPTRTILIKKACTDKLVLEKLLVNREHFIVTKTWTKPGEQLYLEVTPRLDYLPVGPFDEGIAIVASGEEFRVRLTGIVR